MNRELFIEIRRLKISYYFKYNLYENSYDNNTKNNMLDSLLVIDINTENIIFSSLVQTISNHPSYKYSDTIAPGKFKIKCFVDQGLFNTPIHGIVDAHDINGQIIDNFSMQNDNGQYIGRWLVHSSYYKPLNRDTKGYSGGCIISSTKDLLSLNEVLINNGLKSGDLINASLIEV